MDTELFQYFLIEAQDLIEGITQNILSLEKAPNNVTALNKLLRFTHTLKGAARVVDLGEVSQLAHSIEDVLAPYREGSKTIEAEVVSKVLAYVDDIQKKLEGNPNKEVPSKQSEEKIVINKREHASGIDRTSNQTADYVRVSINDLDNVIKELIELKLSTNSLSTVLKSFSDFKYQISNKFREQDAQSLFEKIQSAFSTYSEKIERNLNTIKEDIYNLRLMPANSIFPILERSVRDSSVSLRKQVRFESQGGDLRLDAHVLNTLKEALIHLVRNSVAHGIETTEDRLKKGKKESSTVRISVERRGKQLAFICEDDGRGFDLDAIRQLAIKRRLISENESHQLDIDRAIQLIVQGGMSTTESPTQVSGRGVGLKVAYDIVKSLKGHMIFHSTEESGTKIEIIVYTSLETIKVLSFLLLGTAYSLPLDEIKGILHLKESDFTYSADQITFAYEGVGASLKELSRIVSGNNTFKPRTIYSTIVIESNKILSGYIVDSILGLEEVILQPMSKLAGEQPLLIGYFLNHEGIPQLVFSPEHLVVHTDSQKTLEAEKHFVPKVLIIDDSLTSRILEQSVLESAGFEVSSASSGEEALEKIGSESFDLLVIDVEMPGISGFEFLTIARKMPKTAETPAVFITSLSTPQDREKGRVAGANAYIVKQEFNENEFVNIVRNLVHS